MFGIADLSEIGTIPSYVSRDLSERDYPTEDETRKVVGVVHLVDTVADKGVGR